MKEVLVLNKQTLGDLALQLFGSTDPLLQLAFANDMSLTDELDAGTVLQVPELEVVEQRVVNHYQAYQVRPATALDDAVFAIIDKEDPCDLCKCFL